METSLKLKLTIAYMQEQIIALTAENTQLKVENARLKAESLANSVAEHVLAEHCSVGSE